MAELSNEQILTAMGSVADNVDAPFTVTIQRARAVIAADRALRAEPVAPSPEVLNAIGRLLADDMDRAVKNGANSVSMPDHLVEIAAWFDRSVKHLRINGRWQSIRPLSAKETGATYRIAVVTNTCKWEHPTTVVFFNEATDTRWSCPLESFLHDFIELKDQ